MTKQQHHQQENFATNVKALKGTSANYHVNPRLDYRTVIGVNGPLVILDHVKVWKLIIPVAMCVYMDI